MKQAIKDTIEAGIEQVAGPKQKPLSQQPQQKKTTIGLGDQINPGKAFSDALKQSLGFGAHKPVPTPEELAKMKDEERKKAEEAIVKEQESIGIKTTTPSKSKANIELINPPKTAQTEVPEYIKGKPGYNPEGKTKEKKNKLPELVQPTSKQRRGDLYGVNRKKTSIENKSGYSG